MKSIEELKQEAIEELQWETDQEQQSGITDISDFGISGYETDDAFEVEQDISGILQEVREERDMRSDGMMKVEKGTRKFATIPLTHIIEYRNKYGVDILDADVSRDKWEMAKFRMWIQKDHSYLMVREAGTRFNKTV